MQFYFWVASMLFYMPYMMYICLDIAYVKPLIKMLHNPVVSAGEMSILVGLAPSQSYYHVLQGEKPYVEC